MLKRAKSFFIKRKKYNEDELELPEASHLRRNASVKVSKKKPIELKSEILTTQRPQRKKSFLKWSPKHNKIDKSSSRDELNCQTLNANEEFIYESHRKSKSLDRGVNNVGKGSSREQRDWFDGQVFVDGAVELRGSDLVNLEKRSDTWCSNTLNEQHLKMKSKLIADELKMSSLFNQKRNFKLQPTATLKRFMTEFQG